MDYKDALKYNYEVDARIKCTYTRVYASDGAYLFSFQREKMKETVLGVATAHADGGGYGLIPIEISDAAASVMYTYISKIVKTGYGMSESVARLSKHWFPGTNKMVDHTFYVKPVNCNWQPKGYIVSQTVTTNNGGTQTNNGGTQTNNGGTQTNNEDLEVETVFEPSEETLASGKSSKAGVALALAALLQLLDN